MDLAHLFFGFKGRISRKGYWIAGCVLLVASVISVLIRHYLAHFPALILDLVLLYPNLAVMIKRAHDRDMPSAAPNIAVVLAALSYIGDFLFTGAPDLEVVLFLFLVIPLAIIAVWLFIMLGFFKGTRGPNRYGPDPLETRP